MSHTPDAKADLSAAKCLRSYAKAWSKLHRDIADDFERGAEALEQRASLEQSDAVMGEAVLAELEACRQAFKSIEQDPRTPTKTRDIAGARAHYIDVSLEAARSASEKMNKWVSAAISTPIAPVQDDDAEWPIGRNAKLDELMVLVAVSAASESGNGYDLNIIKSEAERAAKLWREHEARLSRQAGG